MPTSNPVLHPRRVSYPACCDAELLKAVLIPFEIQDGWYPQFISIQLLDWLLHQDRQLPENAPGDARRASKVTMLIKRELVQSRSKRPGLTD
jgi:hypothetical protein